jgi:hypothetical protein
MSASVSYPDFIAPRVEALGPRARGERHPKARLRGSEEVGPVIASVQGHHSIPRKR